jgi:peptide/nickel transport system substrate-binding protein
MFWWEDQINNEELTPTGPTWVWANADVIAVDDYTVRIDFSEPAPIFMAALSHPYTASQGHFYLPKHFQQKWHIDYNADANKVAKEEGYESWIQAFNFHTGKWVFEQRENMPGLYPWVITKVTSTSFEAERNPYFWQVDTAGNQLPYIDKLVATRVQEAQTKILQAIGGEIKYMSGFGFVSIMDFPLLKENEQAGGYRVLQNKGDYASAFTVGFNPTVKDPVLYDIFHDIRFRQALSIAIDRDALNEAVFFGLAIPRQVAPLPNVTFYKDEWSDYMTQYDPDEANELLDEMGLKWDANKKLRLRPDGKPMNLLMESGHGTEIEATVAEVIKNMWEKVGITLTIKPEKLTPERLQDGELYEMMIVDGGGNSTEMDLRGSEYYFWVVGGGGYAWNRWLAGDAQGNEELKASGVEPPDEWKEYAKWVDESLKLVPGTAEWVAMKQKVWDFKVQQLWHIGTVYASPLFDVVSNNLRNVPSGFWFGWSIGFHPLLMTQQWFLKQ